MMLFRFRVHPHLHPIGFGTHVANHSLTPTMLPERASCLLLEHVDSEARGNPGLSRKDTPYRDKPFFAFTSDH